jgi:hypothetical protein
MQVYKHGSSAPLHIVERCTPVCDKLPGYSSAGCSNGLLVQVNSAEATVDRVHQLLSEGTFIDDNTQSISGLLVTYNDFSQAFAIARLQFVRQPQVSFAYSIVCRYSYAQSCERAWATHWPRCIIWVSCAGNVLAGGVCRGNVILVVPLRHPRGRGGAPE